MHAANAAGVCWASRARTAASGTAANISSIAATCCLPANPAERLYPATWLERPKRDAAAAPPIRHAPHAKTAGWSNAAAAMVNSLAASAIPHVSGKRSRRVGSGAPSKSRELEPNAERVCRFKDTHGSEGVGPNRPVGLLHRVCKSGRSGMPHHATARSLEADMVSSTVALAVFGIGADALPLRCQGRHRPGCATIARAPGAAQRYSLSLFAPKPRTTRTPFLARSIDNTRPYRNYIPIRDFRETRKGPRSSRWQFDFSALRHRLVNC